MKIELHEFEETEKYILHVKHFTVDNNGKREVYIETGILNGIPNSLIANDRWYNSSICDFHHIHPEEINEVILFLIGIAEFNEHVFKSVKNYIQIWNILCDCGIVEIKENFDSTNNKEK